MVVPNTLAARAPLPYTVRSTARTRRVTLRVIPGQGLVVSVPKRFLRREIPALVEAHRDWAEAALADLARTTPAACLAWPPEVLELAALGRSVRVQLPGPADAPSAWTGEVRSSQPRPGKARPGKARPGKARFVDNLTLRVDVSPESRAAFATAIAAALRAEARRCLVPQLAFLAERHDLSYERVAVRGQRTVWGSCSSRGTISLNYKLLFLPPGLVNYVLLHELAHTRHLDHSKAFWQLLATLDPTTREREQELRRAGPLVPTWLDLARAPAA